MAEFLQQHAGFHFTLAFVELALFKASGGYIAQPRVIAKTTNIDRAIVTVVDGRVTVSPPKQSVSGTRNTITEERYFEELEKNLPGVSAGLTAFLDSLRACNIRAEYGSDSLIFGGALTMAGRGTSERYLAGVICGWTIWERWQRVPTC